MGVPLDILDTQILVFGATGAKQWAEERYQTLINSDRIAYLPRYVLSEFQTVLPREHKTRARPILLELWDRPNVFCAHPDEARAIQKEQLRNHTVTQTLARVCSMEPKDAPILAEAVQLAAFVNSRLGGGGVSQNHPEEWRLLSYLERKLPQGKTITPRILTNERGFINGNLANLGLGNVTVKRIP